MDKDIQKIKVKAQIEALETLLDIVYEDVLIAHISGMIEGLRKLLNEK